MSHIHTAGIICFGVLCKFLNGKVSLILTVLGVVTLLQGFAGEFKCGFAWGGEAIGQLPRTKLAPGKQTGAKFRWLLTTFWNLWLYFGYMFALALVRGPLERDTVVRSMAHIGVRRI